MNTARASEPQTVRSRTTNNEFGYSEISIMFRWLGPVYIGLGRVIRSIHGFLNLDGLKNYEAFADEFKLGGVGVVGFAIGLVGGIHLCITIQILIGVIRGEKTTPLLKWSLFILGNVIYYFIEFMAVALFRPKNISRKSFLFPHDCEYLGGMLAFILEFWIELIVWPNLKRGFGLVAWVGIFLIIIENTKVEGRELITNGVYSILRHPSYTGFFWFTIGGQLLLSNPISVVAICYTLFIFFKSRIREEELILTEFYPDKYPKYRKRTYVLIPCL